MAGIDGLAYTIGMLIFIVILFLIFREVVCWYWKINERTKVMGEIKDLLVLINSKLSSPETLEGALGELHGKEDLSIPKKDGQGRYIIPKS